MSHGRRALGEAGERVAAWWLSERGLSVTARNVAVEGGEIDIVARDGNDRVAVEVRTMSSPGDPIDAVDSAKRSHVARIASAAGATRVDYLGIGIRPWGIEVHWIPGRGQALFSPR